MKKGRKILRVSPAILVDLLLLRSKATEQRGLPEDMRIVEARWDERYQLIELLCESAEFPVTDILLPFDTFTAVYSIDRA